MTADVNAWHRPGRVVEKRVDARLYVWVSWRRAAGYRKHHGTGARTDAHLKDKERPGYTACRLKIGEQAKRERLTGSTKCRTCERRWIEIQARAAGGKAT